MFLSNHYVTYSQKYFFNFIEIKWPISSQDILLSAFRRILITSPIQKLYVNMTYVDINLLYSSISSNVDFKHENRFPFLDAMFLTHTHSSVLSNWMVRKKWPLYSMYYGVTFLKSTTESIFIFLSS